MRGVGALALLVLLAKVMAGVVVPAAQGTQRAAIDAVLGPVVLCTAHGAESAAGPGPALPAPAEHCPLCTLIGAFALIVALAAAMLVFPAARTQQWAPVPAGLLPCHLGLGLIRSRGPPLPA